MLSRHLHLLLERVRNVRFQHDAPTIVQLGPFFWAKDRAFVGDVAIGNQRGLQCCGSLPNRRAQEVVHSLQDDSAIAGDVLEAQVRFAIHSERRL